MEQFQVLCLGAGRIVVVDCGLQAHTKFESLFNTGCSTREWRVQYVVFTPRGGVTQTEAKHNTWLMGLGSAFRVTCVTASFQKKAVITQARISLLWVSASCCACNNEWIQQSFVGNYVSACFIKQVYHNMFRLKSKPSSSVVVYRILNVSNSIIRILTDSLNLCQNFSRLL
jgi:hypothetical protein